VALTDIIPALYRRSGAWRIANAKALDAAYLALFFAYKRFVEDPFAALVRKHPELFAGGDIVDVGANAGYTASVFARAVSPGFHVHALEPEPVNFRRLQRVARRFGGVIVPQQVAAGAADGTASLAINPQHPGDHRVVAEGALRVPMIAVDRFDRAVFVKIDVQGTELEVSRGMEQLLQRGVSVAFEFAPRELPDPAALLDFYRSRGFDLRMLTHGGELLPIDEERVAARGYVDILATRGAA